MFLVIDNTAGDKLVFFVSENEVDWRTYEFPSDKNGALLIALEKILKETTRSLNELRGLAVKVGKGKFTSTRIAVTVGNTLAYALKIPIVADKEIDLSTIIEKIKNTPVGEYALPVYSGEPRLGNK